MTATAKPISIEILAAGHEPAEDVVAVVVRPQHVATGRGQVALDYVRVDLVGVVKQRSRQS